MTPLTKLVLMTWKHGKPGRSLRWGCGVVALVLHFSAVTHADDQAGIEFFEKKVRPVLVANCHSCHSASAKKLKGGLRLDSRAALLKGGDSGAALAPGNPDKSRIIDAIQYENVELQMPPKGKLPAEVISDLTAWVRMGAPWPAEAGPGNSTSESYNLAERKRSHWAWQSVQAQSPPPVRDSTWPDGAVDRFLLTTLEAKGLRPASTTNRQTLIRRASLDLIGLPPTPDEVDAFVNDGSPDAFEKIVDRLLASPHFGERWARHWLDLVRYAETRGHEFDFPIPNAFQYRDYVIRALNADVPYQQLVLEHIAGDLLKKPRLHPTLAFNESILGTGFWFLGEGVHSPVDIRQDEADRFDNMIDVMSKTFLGMTVACARCHDHKFDAISTKDYYSLYGFLKSSSYRLAPFDRLEEQRRLATEWRLASDRSASTLMKAVGEAISSGVGRTADYLAAAREAILNDSDAESLVFPSSSERLTELTDSHKLEVEKLQGWMAAIAAATEADDILYPWATLCRRMDEAQSRAVLKSVIHRLRKADTKASKTPEDCDIVIDYAACDPSQWMPDGFAWGPGPVRPGDVRFRLAKDGLSPYLAERAAAEIDPVWNRIRITSDSEIDPTAFGGIVRAGRTLRTPTFTINQSGRLHFLMKGTGRAYIAVGSYVLFDGPLHKNLLMPIKAGPHFRWVSSLDLSAYAGQRAHVEFTAADDSEFGVACVVQGAKPPTSPAKVHPLDDMSCDGDSLGAIAAAYQRMFHEAATTLANEPPHTPARPRLHNWMLRKRELFASENGKRLIDDTLARIRVDLAPRHGEAARPSSLALAMWDGPGIDEHVFVRGSHRATGEPAPRRFLEALVGPHAAPIKHGSGRLELATQMTDPAVNPLIARVMVNRIWHHLFGRGIVESVDNFGVMGTPPTHPELLDYLADRFVADGWSIKRLIRELITSRAYQMDSRSEPSANELDPENHCWHRANVKRLDAEVIRDCMLAASGRLDRRVYGRSAPVYLTDFQQGRARPRASGPLDGDGRRSIYLAAPRNFLTPMLTAFDFPTPSSTMGKRTVSNVPAQALIMMNDPFVHQQAERWANQVLSQAGSTRERIASMYRIALARMPTEEEISRCSAFVERGGDLSAWTDLAHALFNLKEFIFQN